MANAKFVKTAAAVALGTSVVATAVAPSASAATSDYKVKSGKLITIKTGKVVKGFKTFKSVLYKDGKKYTGLRSGKYYKNGVLTSGTYKGIKYQKGLKFTGISSSDGKYYKNGVVGTGTYKDVKYKKGVKFTGVSTNGKYYKNGVLGTGTYENVKYKKGEKFTGVSTNGKYYENGVVATGVKTVDDVVYVDGVKDEVAPEITAEDTTVEYGSTVDVATLATVKDNSGEEIKATAVITFDGKEVSAIDTKAPGKYTVAYAAKDANGNEGKKEITVTVAEPAKVAVESVTALDAKTIQVKFNKAVKEESAKTLSNYLLNNQVVTGATIELSEDAKTATITLATDLANNSDNVLTVNPVVSKDDAKVSTELFTTAFKFSDSVKPEFVNVVNDAKGTVTANFSEAVDPTTVISSNITVTKADGTVVTVSPTATDAANTVVLTKTNNGFKLSGLEDKVEYNVTVVGFKDLVGNLTNPNVVKFTAKSTAEADTVAPKVTDVQSKGLDTVVVTVDEELKNIAATDAPAKYVTLSGVTADEAQAQVYDKTTGTVTIKLASASLPAEGSLKTVKVTDYKDIAGNAGAEFSKNIGFSNISNVTKTELVTLPTTVEGVTKEAIKVTFDNDITLAATVGNISAILLTKDNVEKTVAIDSTKLAVGTVADKETNVLYIDLSDLELEEGTLSFSLTKDNQVSTLTKEAKLSVAYKPVSTNNSVPALDTNLDSNGIKVDKNKVTVQYTQDMGQTALDVNNYTVDGKKVFETAVFKGNKKTVELTLKANVIEVDSVYDIVISKAVANEKGISLAKDYVSTEVFSNTVQPTVKSAKLVDGSVKVTLDKAVTASAGAFELYVEGTKVGVSAALTTANTEVTITPDTALTAADLAKAITVKAAENAEVKDANDNVLATFGSVTVAK